MSLTTRDREWRKEMNEALAHLHEAIIAINGPHAQMTAALEAQQAVADLAIDDEDMGPCASCEEPIWLIADDGQWASNDDGDRFCMSCVKRWEEPTPSPRTDGGGE